MSRVLVLAMLALAIPPHTSGQALSILHIKVTLVDADQAPTAVPRHALLISDNPASAAPRRIVTALDGTADVKLAPGSYTVESDRPVAFNGKAYEWTQMIDIVAGRDAVLELSASNAAVADATSSPATAGAPLAADPAFLLIRWQDSVVGIWTPTGHASGFLVDAKGLMVTSRRVLGTATSVEVQLTPAVKVAANVLVADPARDVAILWIDPKAVESVRPLPLGCTPAAKPVVVNGQELFSIRAPLREEKGMTSGAVSRVEEHAIVAELFLARGSAGGPVFDAGGAVVGVSSSGDDKDEGRRQEFRIVPVGDACEAFAAALDKMKGVAAPSGTHLPVEPARPFPVAALKEAVKERAGSLNPYQISSADFDVAFITPVMTYGVQYQSEQVSGREKGRSPRTPAPEPAFVRPLMDFGIWGDYVADFPPVLLIRVTPRFVEGFWTTVARGAARTQGVALPPIKRFKPGFARMRAFCGDAEVTPIHPFKLEQRVSENDAINEGLYVFDPDALGPQCGTVKLVLFSEKEPDKGDTRVVDAKVIQQVWQDFAPYRAQKAGGNAPQPQTLQLPAAK